MAVILMTALVACSTHKNTATSRWWQAFNTRYNVYYNGAQAYIEGSLAKESGNKDNFTEMIPLYTVGNKSSRELGKSNYETAITKAQKAIKLHSIKQKPTWTKDRKKTEKDIAWLTRREYNPFMWKAWMLMGRSQFYKGDFDEAAATFSYMSRLYKTQPAIYAKARAWLAKCYIEQDWMYDAEDVIRNMMRDSNNWKAQKEWDYTLADYYTHLKDWPNSEKYLRLVIKHEKRKKQRAREYYLLGQVLAAEAKDDDAYKAFNKVINQSPPYELEFNARISMTEVLPPGKAKEKIRKLKSMARSDKNAEYLDQIYYALGNVYLAQKDTVKAIDAYENGNNKATRSGIEKGVLLLHLGNLYWEMERYSDAKRCYGTAIGLLDKERKDYEELSNRSKILDELCPYTDAVHLQDSLQSLAKMSEKDRNAAIDRVIEALKKKEKEERKLKQQQEAEAQQAQNGGNDLIDDNNKMNTTTSTFGTNSSIWYFYNQQAISQGKQTFRTQWGNRKNEDNWQRINKTVVDMSEDEIMKQTEEDTNAVLPDSLSADSIGTDSLKRDTVSQDPHTREYYLAQIPFTEEQLAESNKILSDGLFNSGVIFKDKLDNLPLSDKALTRLLRDFPDFEKKDEVLYHLFLLRNREGRAADGDVYKDSLAAEFPESQWTILITDPYFRENALYGTHIEDSLYTVTYDAFRNDLHKTIDLNAEISEKRFPLGNHRDKFIFVSGMSHLNRGDADSCLNAMKRIVKYYPNSDVSAIAGMIVKGVEAGRKLHGAKFDIGDLWNRRTIELSDMKRDSTAHFTADRNTEFYFVMTYDPDSLNKVGNFKSTAENQLLFEIAKYNFTSYLVRNFDVVIENYQGIHRLIVSGFGNFDEAYQYVHQLFQQQTIAQIASRSRNIIISKSNYEMLGIQFSYNDYDEFYQKHYAPLKVHKANLLNDPHIDPSMYDPELQPSKKNADAEENAEDNFDVPATGMDIDIPSDTPAVRSTGNDININEPINEPKTSTEITIEEPKVTSKETPKETPQAKPVEIKPDEVNPQKKQNTQTVRQQINSEVIEIIDEDNQSSGTNNTKKKEEKQQDDDEYFDFDGF